MSQLPIVLAAIIHDNLGHVLVCRRNYGDLAGKWEFPGGKPEPGETDQEALAREIREELGVECEVGALFDATPFRNKFELRCYHVFVKADLTNGRPVPFKLAAHDYAWFTDARNLPSFDLLPADVPAAWKLIQGLAE